jgi:hypothetical protein
MRKLIGNLAISIAAAIILLSVMELLARAYCPSKYIVKTRDAQLGWKGMTIMGDTESKKTKIFFVGDSFTANYLNGRMYFDTIKHNLNIEAFVYGGLGYGTLQEYLVINRYIDKIRPDLIVLQVCSNDFINNSWDLESRSYIHNNYSMRPYYEKGKINYRFPRGNGFLRQYLIPHSRLAYLIALRIDRMLANLAKKGRVKTVENDIEYKGLDFNEFKRSVDTTLELMIMIKKRCDKVPVIAFPVFDDEPYFSQFKAIFKKSNIDFLSAIPRLAWDSEEPQKVRNYDHWTEKGHSVCGAYISNYIKRSFLSHK